MLAKQSEEETICSILVNPLWMVGWRNWAKRHFSPKNVTKQCHVYDTLESPFAAVLLQHEQQS